MRVFFYLVVLLICSGGLISCEGDLYNDVDPTCVVEGWIETGSSPKFYVTNAISVAEALQNYQNLSEINIDKEASIWINDGEKEFLLYPESNTNHVISTCYTNKECVGKEGKTYMARILIDDHEFLSFTTIPKTRFEGDVYFEESDEPGLYQIKMRISQIDNSELGRIFVRIDGLTDDFLLTPSTLIDGSECEIMIPRPNLQYFNNGQTGYQSGEVVQIKVSMMDKNIFQMWEDYEKRLDLSRNPLFQLTTNLTSSLGENIVGYWAGYNSFFFEVRIP